MYNTKEGGRAVIMNTCEVIHKDLDKIIKCCDEWWMSYNVEKCKVMHCGTPRVNIICSVSHW